MSIVSPVASLQRFEGKWGIVVSGLQTRGGAGEPQKSGYLVAVLWEEGREKRIVR